MALSISLLVSQAALDRQATAPDVRQALRPRRTGAARQRFETFVDAIIDVAYIKTS
jgi:hypothetical protein